MSSTRIRFSWRTWVDIEMLVTQNHPQSDDYYLEHNLHFLSTSKEEDMLELKRTCASGGPEA